VRRVEEAIVAIAGPDALCLRTPVETRGEGFTTVSEFSITAGERLPFVLTWFHSHEPLPKPIDAEQALTDTEAYWLGWAAACGHEGEYHEEIHQSLKALTYQPTGGIVAAPTTSLPEQLGGVRNWDYRYCRLRDARLTLLAMLRSGYREEAVMWHQWLLRAVAGSAEDVQIMYGLAGERRLDERELGWLPGYEASTPVRVGNAASAQLQLDVYGEVLDALYHTSLRGAPADADVWSLAGRLLGGLESGWKLPDAGIWEVRGPERHFTHSKMTAWVAFDRGVHFNEEVGQPAPCRGLADDRRRDPRDRVPEAWSSEKQAFTQSFGSTELDASGLLMPLVGFLAARDERMVSTVEAIRRELGLDGLVMRYRPEAEGVDGLPGGEGVFLPCSFWLVSVLALQGRRVEARELFERLLGLRNDVGLLAEEYDPVANRQLGNFPQAFTHLALVDAAYSLSEDQGLREG
jgi:GH15 family glucan-1,4-alpha-glucosidase